MMDNVVYVINFSNKLTQGVLREEAIITAALFLKTNLNSFFIYFLKDNFNTFPNQLKKFIFFEKHET